MHTRVRKFVYAIALTSTAAGAHGCSAAVEPDATREAGDTGPLADGSDAIDSTVSPCTCCASGCISGTTCTNGCMIQDADSTPLTPPAGSRWCTSPELFAHGCGIAGPAWPPALRA